MSELQGGRWEGFTRRLFSLKGVIEPQSVSPELIGTVAVIPARAEDAILRRDKLYHGVGIGTDAASNHAQVNLRNDSTGSIVTLEQAWAYSGVAAWTLSVRMGNNPIGTGPVTIAGRDTRLGLTLPGKSQAGQIRAGRELALTGTEVQRVRTPLDTLAVVGCPIVLGPGDAVFLWNASVQNVTMTCSFLWSEREAEPGELTL